MTKPAAKMNRSTVHALSPMQSCRDRGRQSFIFHAKRQLGQFARSTLQQEFGRANAAEDTGSQVELLDRHPAFAAWSALNIGTQQQMETISQGILWTAPRAFLRIGTEVWIWIGSLGRADDDTVSSLSLVR